MSNTFFQLSNIEPQISLIDIKGNIGMDQEGEFRTLMDQQIQEGKAFIILNFEQVEFLCSPSIGTIAISIKKLRNKTGKVILVNCSPYIMEIFQMTGLKELLEFSDSVESVVQKLKNEVS